MPPGQARRGVCTLEACMRAPEQGWQLVHPAAGLTVHVDDVNTSYTGVRLCD